MQTPTIDSILTTLSAQLNERLKNDKSEKIIFLCVLRGAFMFFSDLVKKIDRKDIIVEFVSISTYHNNQQSSSANIIFNNPKLDFTNSSVYIVEDIVDSGQSMAMLFEYFINHTVKWTLPQLTLITLLSKKTKSEILTQIRPFDYVYIGSLLENDDYVYGYGLDNNGKERNLTELRTIRVIE